MYYKDNIEYISENKDTEDSIESSQINTDVLTEESQDDSVNNVNENSEDKEEDHSEKVKVSDSDNETSTKTEKLDDTNDEITNENLEFEKAPNVSIETQHDDTQV